MQELPAFQQVYEKYAGQITMLAVAVRETGDPQKYFKDHGFTFTLVKDVDGSDAYNVRSIPYTVIIDKDGNQIADHVGRYSSAELDLIIQQAL